MLPSSPTATNNPELFTATENIRAAVVLPFIVAGVLNPLNTIWGVILLLEPLAGPVPCALVAVTVKVYVVPTVRPATVIGLEEPVPVMPPGLLVAV